MTDSAQHIVVSKLWYVVCVEQCGQTLPIYLSMVWSGHCADFDCSFKLRFVLRAYRHNKFVQCKSALLMTWHKQSKVKQWVIVTDWFNSSKNQLRRATKHYVSYWLLHHWQLTYKWHSNLSANTISCHNWTPTFCWVLNGCNFFPTATAVTGIIPCCKKHHNMARVIWSEVVIPIKVRLCTDVNKRLGLYYYNILFASFTTFKSSLYHYIVS